MRVRRRSTHRAHAGRAGSTGGGVRGSSGLSLRGRPENLQKRFALLAAALKTLNVPKAAIFAHCACVNLRVKVRHRGGELTACRCSSSYGTTARQKQREKGMDRKRSDAGMKNKLNVIRLKEWRERQRQTEREGGRETTPPERRRNDGRAVGLSPSGASSVLPAAPSAPSCSPARTTSSAPAHLFFV